MRSKGKKSALRILLADDDADDRSFFEKALASIPIVTSLHIVADGEELMKYLLEHTGQLPDILFLDLSMPRKTGYECLIEVKEHEKLKNLHVVMFSTSFTGRHLDLEHTLKNTLSEMGAENYIRKPGDFEELKQIIHQALIRFTETLPVTGKEEKGD